MVRVFAHGVCMTKNNRVVRRRQLNVYSLSSVIYQFNICRRCSSMVRAFAHVTMGHQIDPSSWTH